jgi:hypothetical protein
MIKTLVLLAVLAGVVGCEDRYRYHCQDPKNWAQKRCQRPDCQFTQDCPDYLVAPVLEKQNAVQQATEAASAPANR